MGKKKDRRKYQFINLLARQLNLSRAWLYVLLNQGRVQGARLVDGRWDVPVPVVILPGRPPGRPRK